MRLCSIYYCYAVRIYKMEDNYLYRLLLLFYVPFARIESQTVKTPPAYHATTIFLKMIARGGGRRRRTPSSRLWQTLRDRLRVILSTAQIALNWARTGGEKRLAGPEPEAFRSAALLLACCDTNPSEPFSFGGVLVLLREQGWGVSCESRRKTSSPMPGLRSLVRSRTSLP